MCVLWRVVCVLWSAVCVCYGGWCVCAVEGGVCAVEGGVCMYTCVLDSQVGTYRRSPSQQYLSFYGSCSYETDFEQIDLIAVICLNHCGKMVLIVVPVITKMMDPNNPHPLQKDVRLFIIHTVCRLL